MTVELMLNPTIVRTSHLRIIDRRQTGPSRTDRHNPPRVTTAQRMPNLTIARTNEPRATGQRQTEPNQTDQNPLDLRLGLKRLSRHDRRPAMTVRLTKNLTIVPISRLRIIAPKQTGRNPIDLKLVDLRRVGPRRIVRHNRRRAMTVRITQNLTIVLISRLRIIAPRQTGRNRIDRKLIDPSRIGLRRTALKIDPRQSPLELRNVNNRSHKHPKRKSARTSSARRSHSHLSKQQA
jgi:hypothetical protein